MSKFGEDLVASMKEAVAMTGRKVPEAAGQEDSPDRENVTAGSASDPTDRQPGAGARESRDAWRLVWQHGFTSCGGPDSQRGTPTSRPDTRRSIVRPLFRYRSQRRCLPAADGLSACQGAIPASLATGVLSRRTNLRRKRPGPPTSRRPKVAPERSLCRPIRFLRRSANRKSPITCSPRDRSGCLAGAPRQDRRLAVAYRKDSPLAETRLEARHPAGTRR